MTHFYDDKNGGSSKSFLVQPHTPKPAVLSDCLMPASYTTGKSDKGKEVTGETLCLADTDQECSYDSGSSDEESDTYEQLPPSSLLRNYELVATGTATMTIQDDGQYISLKRNYPS